MNALILKLEELIIEHKGITELISALSSVQGGVINDYTTGINLLAKLSLDNNEGLENVWQKMYQIIQKSS